MFLFFCLYELFFVSLSANNKQLMSVIITDQASTIEFLFSTGERKVLDKDNLNIKEENSIFSKWVFISNSTGFVQTAENDVIKLKYSDVTSPSLSSNQELIDLILLYKASSGYTIGSVVITDGTRSVTLEPNGSLPVTLQDQTTPIVITRFNKLEVSTTLSVAAAIDDVTITVSSPTGISAGKILTVWNTTASRYSQFYVISVLGSVVTVDSPVDFAYPIGSIVDVGDTNMAVDGSTTPVIFGIRNGAQVPISFDCTRIIIKCITSTAPILTDFGDITGGLTNGIVLRRIDGAYQNIFNCKDNGEISGITFDFQIFATNFGVDGFSSRLTFAGQSKMGATIRLGIDEDLQLIVQDNLSSLIGLEIAAEGSIVQP